MVFKKFFPLLLFVIFLILTLSLLTSANAKQNPPKKLRALSHRNYKNACNTPGAGNVSCHAKLLTQNDNVSPFAGGTPFDSSMGPSQLHTAYQLPCTPGGAVDSNCATPQSFGPRTIAIVDAYNYPTVENDLVAYSNQFNIPVCTKANGCLTVINENGGSSLPSTVDQGWSLEAALDVETAHAVCQTCKILLVEASSATFADMGKAVATAASRGATAISNSYGASEWRFETSFDSYYNHPGVAVTASSGDGGYGASYPAASPYVVGVGGTTLQLFDDNSYDSESAWSGGGSGCSKYEPILTTQSLISGLAGKCSRRVIADVSADADPNSGAAVYTTTAYSGVTGWFQVGGTSLSSPIIAAVYALTNVSISGQANLVPYNNNSTANFHDILTGSNGGCGTLLCNALLGFDGPTGLGSPNGLGGFGGAAAIATPTDTPTSIPTVTVTPSDTPTPTDTPTITSTPTPTPTSTPTPTPISSGDTTSPTVTILSPSNGSHVFHGFTYTLMASASDNVKVSKVEFYVNGNLTGTDTTSLYTASWKVPAGINVTYTITAKAYDTSGNSSSVSITVTSQ